MILPVTATGPNTPNEPVIRALPVKGNAAPPPPLPVATVKVNVVASALVNVYTLPLTLPVLIKLPVDWDAVYALNDAVVSNFSIPNTFISLPIPLWIVQ